MKHDYHLCMGVIVKYQEFEWGARDKKNMERLLYFTTKRRSH